MAAQSVTIIHFENAPVFISIIFKDAKTCHLLKVEGASYFLKDAKTYYFNEG